MWCLHVSPHSLLHVAREVITAATATIPSLGWGRARMGWTVDGGGCHGNCESVAGSTSSVVARCGVGTWIFELYGHGQWHTHTLLPGPPPPPPLMEAQRGHWRGRGGREGRGGWMDGWMEERRGHKQRLTDLHFISGRVFGYLCKQKRDEDAGTEIENWNDFSRWNEFPGWEKCRVDDGSRRTKREIEGGREGGWVTCHESSKLGHWSLFFLRSSLLLFFPPSLFLRTSYSIF